MVNGFFFRWLIIKIALPNSIVCYRNLVDGAAGVFDKSDMYRFLIGVLSVGKDQWRFRVQNEFVIVPEQLGDQDTVSGSKADIHILILRRLEDSLNHFPFLAG